MLHGDGGELANQLRAFYSSLRRKLVQAQINRSPEEMEALMNAVLKIREAWQKADQSQTASAPQIISASVPASLLPFVSSTTDGRHDDWFA